MNPPASSPGIPRSGIRAPEEDSEAARTGQRTTRGLRPRTVHNLLMATKVLGVVPDLLFKSKISETAKRTGIEVKYCSAATLAARAAEEKPGLIVIDLN